MSTAGVAALAAVAVLLMPSVPTVRLRALAGVARPSTSGTKRRFGRGFPRALGGKGPARAAADSAADSALALDLLGACLSAGVPVPTAVDAVASVATGAVGEALRDAAHALALGASPESAWRRAREHPDIADLARAACRTASSGTALADQATTLAARIRHLEADGTEARAQRVSVLIVGPLGLCFLPAFLCLGVIPVVLGLASRLHVLP
ncbi:type II secretion system F family protein [Saccharomonospora glauca]|uniref:Flp pilus assembly protein TadC n=1 Tax=Saccharomonospora glauca K62 TaxID=928724 RepID=I1D797_9PSEU|nr:type II secretion system F family protein [Saccharomonospora glauca]EIF00822.1 Flp pilus assembly protein TadC [Saccharomonospora glauca K62]